jgi:hypothetical protein
MQGSDKLAMIDQHFVDIYGAARAQIVDEQKQIALIVIQDDDLLLYRTGQSMERFSGLMPPLYNKMKTVGHIPLAIFCLLYKHTDKPLPEAVLAEISAYRAELKSAAGALDTREEARADILPNPNQIYAKATGFLDAVIARGSVSKKDFVTFAGSVAGDIEPVLTAAARAQLEACDALVAHIRQNLLTQQQWASLRVLVIGPYMAKQGEIFLQYFSKILHTPEQGDERVVYFDGDDLPSAFDRLGTTMLDAIASKTIFGKRDRLHRDVLADATKLYLRDVSISAALIDNSRL